MGYLFDGPSRRIELTPGTTILDLQDCYSRWKEWVQADSNAKYLGAFLAIGGDPIGGGISITPYYFLVNGWRIRPQEASHKLVVANGVLAVAGGGDPFLATVGPYNVLVQYSQPIRTETVATAGTAGPSAVEVADAVWAHGDALDLQARLRLASKILRNRHDTDPETGEDRIYDDDGVTVLLRGALWENVAGTVAYRGQGANRRDRLA